MRAADDFVEIRRYQRALADVEGGHCYCPKSESGTRTETNPHCPSHGRSWEELAKERTP